jgi:hypothetical protein
MRRFVVAPSDPGVPKMISPCWLSVVVLGVAVLASNHALAQDAKTFRVQSKSGLIQVISDREESVPAYFQRHRMVVAIMSTNALKKCLSADKTMDKQSVNNASFNDDAGGLSKFVASLNIPVTSPAAAKLVREHLQGKDGKERESVTLILCADAQAKDTYHIVGFTTAAPGDFFADKGFAGDDLRGADLRYKQAQK